MDIIKSEPKLFQRLKLLKTIQFLSVLFYAIAEYPGRLGFDAITAINMMQNSKTDSTWTQLYFRFLQITTFDGNITGLNAILGLLIIVFSLRFFVHSLSFFSEIIREKTLTFLIFSPFIGIYGMTIDHNLQTTSGLLILIGFTIRIINKMEISNHLILFLGIMLVQMSFIGLFSSIFVALALLLGKCYKNAINVAIIWLVVFIAGLNMGVANNLQYISYAPLLSDIKCVAQDADSTISYSDWRIITSMGPINNWQEISPCNTVENVSFIDPKSEIGVMKTLKLWLRIAYQNPRTVVMSHIIKSSVALPPILFHGPPDAVSSNLFVPVGQGVSKNLHQWSVLLNDSSIQNLTHEYIPHASKYLQIIPITLALLVNQKSSFWGWAGMWFLLVSVIVFKKRSHMSFLAFLPLAAVHLLLVIASPVSDPRYSYSTTIIGITFSGLLAVNYFSKQKLEIFEIKNN